MIAAKLQAPKQAGEIHDAGEENHNGQWPDGRVFFDLFISRVKAKIFATAVSGPIFIQPIGYG